MAKRTSELLVLVILSGCATTLRVRRSWTCPREKGICLREDGRVVSGKVTLQRFGKKSTYNQLACVDHCLAYPGARGCELMVNSSNSSCYVYTNTVARGNNATNAFCWVFHKCQGGLPMFLGNFENHKYDGTNRKKGHHYIHISYHKQSRVTEYIWRDLVGKTCTLYQTEDISKLQCDRNCTGYDNLRFTSAGFYGTGGEFYKRKGLEFVGYWSVSYPRFYSVVIFRYHFSGGDTVKVYKGESTKSSSTKTISASSDPLFPASQGWFKVEAGVLNIVEYIRLKDNFTLESRLFCTDSEVGDGNSYCSKSYKGLSRYCCVGTGIKHRWSLQEENVCFEGKGNKFGTFTMKYSGPLIAIRLVHRSGYINCQENGRSLWGCGNTEGISIAITDDKNDIILPRRLSSNGWTWLRGYDGRTSRKIILGGSQKSEVSKGMVMRLWYGEDLRDKTENDNRGRSCVDVYSKITRKLSTRPPLGDAVVKVTFRIKQHWRSVFYDSSSIDYFQYEKRILDDIKKYFHSILNDTLLQPLNVSTLLHLSINELKRSSGGFTEVNLIISNYLSSVPHTSNISPSNVASFFCQDVIRAARGIKLSSFSLIGRQSIKSYRCCFEEVLGDDRYKGKYIFNTIPIHESVTLPCKYDASVSLTRECFYNDEYGGSAEWRKPNLQKCPPKSKTTLELDKLNTTSHIRSVLPINSLHLAQSLNKIIPSASVITTPTDLMYISDITSVIVGGADNSHKVDLTENVLETFTVVLDTPPTLVGEAEKSSTSATSLLKNMQTFCERMGHSMSSLGSNITVSKSNIGFQVAKVARQDLKIYSHLETLGQVSVGINDYSMQVTSKFLASIYIPSSAFTLSEGMIYSQAYLTSTLFVDKNQITSAEEGTSTVSPVQSLILSVSVGTDVSQLEHPVILQFKKMSSTAYNSTCSFWVFRDGDTVGRWSSSGCMFLNETTHGIVTCQCNHLTNFAILTDVYQTGSNPLSLQIITWIGCVISLIGLVITIVIYSCFRNLRAKLPAKILLCLCISLSIFILVFIVGIEKSKHRISCQVIAVILHYFMMTSFAWMCVTAVNLFQLLVLVFRRGNENRFFVKVSIVAWGVPLIIVVVTALIQPQELGNDNFCFPQGNAAHFGVLLPIAIVLAINVFVLISIVVKFARSKHVGDMQEQRQNVNQTRIALSVTVLLGVTWIIAIFAVKDAEFIFQLLFCIFNSLQGFLIFILYTLTNKTVQKEVKSYLRGKFPNYSSSGEHRKTVSTEMPLRGYPGGKKDARLLAEKNVDV